ncbi:hypothetical protein FRC11_009821 [Ceratobasidium sp. 423]|nr:hypothetical protein FRC11_009821 [Ceratobasidium sp. 423]
MCGGQKAYPVYVLFGNLDKNWHRKPSKHGMYLLGYLPVDGFKDIPNDNECKWLKAELVHHVMEKMLEPLRMASVHGVEMWCPDSFKRHVYPHVTAYTANWPEQNLQCSTTEGGCPICKTAYKDRGHLVDAAELREQEETLDALHTYICTKNDAHSDPLGLKPVWPWWGDIPDVNLSACLTLDLLHQTYQGLFRHLVQWMKKIIGADVLDDRFTVMPPAEGLAHFMKGISVISSSGRWTGRKSKQLLAQFLLVVAGTLSPQLTVMVCALVNFMYRAQATSLTDANLDVFKEEGCFNKIAKLHMLQHWTHTIRELGAPDGYNTEAPEHLHIEYAKVLWHALNKVKPLPQMVKYIQRQEAIRLHRAYLDQYLAEDQEEPIELDQDAEDAKDNENYLAEVLGAHDNDPNPVSELVVYPNPIRCIASIPTVGNKPIRELRDRYLASNIIPDIKSFLIRRCNVPSVDILLSENNHVDIWHKLYLYHPPPSFAPFNPIHRDVVRVRPPTQRAKDSDSELGVWDVALYLEKPNRLRPTSGPHEKHGIERYRAGCVCAIFTLPTTLQMYYPGPLAYLELFTPFGTHVSPYSSMHGTQPEFGNNGARRTLVLPVSDIFFACHLSPKFQLLDEHQELHSYSDLLSTARYFWLNHYYNHHIYQLIEHWRRCRQRLGQRLEHNLQSSQSQEP